MLDLFKPLSDASMFVGRADDVSPQSVHSAQTYRRIRRQEQVRTEAQSFLAEPALQGEMAGDHLGPRRRHGGHRRSERSLANRATSLCDPTEFLTFLLGIASILALISSITFGFLLYYFQAVNSEKNLLYGRFKDGVKDLRSFLDELHESGVIDESYDYEFGLVEEVTLKDFPLLSWNERIEGVLNVITEEQREELEESGDFGRVLRGVAYRVNDIEEAVQALFINWLQQLSVKRMLLPVLKSFGTLVVVIFAVLLSVLRYDGAVATILGGFGIGVGTMTLLLIIEVTLIAVRESRELYEFRPEAEEAGEVPDTPSVPDSAADATG
jgi:hypothetical protein